MRCAPCDGTLPRNARFCPFCGVPVGLAVTAAPVEERKVVTVVFCDLVGSTALSGVLDPEALRTVILRYFDLMRARLEECGGTVEKFIGDAVMAVFGVPVTHEDDARRALAAALAMLDAVRELNESELHPTFGIRLGVRIGINTGPAVTSTDVSTRQALISGETVNIAARLEQHAAEGEVLIGPETRKAAGPAARTEHVGSLRLKGKTAPVTAFRLLGITEDDPGVSRRFDLPFVGRTRELAALQGALRDVVHGRGTPNVLILYGEAGIGKTRLVHEWRKTLSTDCAQGSGRCRPYGEYGSLTPLADALRQLLRQFPDGHARAGQALAVLAGGLLEDGTPNPSVDDTCAAVGELLASLARSRPIVLVVDDCQWAGDLLLGILGTLAEELASFAVLFVCVARPDVFDRSPGWGPARLRARLLAVLGLTPPEAGAVADALVEIGGQLGGGLAAERAGSRSGTAVPAHVLEAAGGNPFHLEHLLAALAEYGPGYRADGASDLPTTLQALIGARIGALGRAERATLDLAAVVGREFTVDDVLALAERDRENAPGGALHGSAASGGSGMSPARTQVRTALARLRRHRLVGGADGAGREAPAFRFSSGLIHEVTYKSMAKRARAERHEHVASLLAERLPDTAVRGEGRTAEASAAVARHLESAYRYRTELGIADSRTDELRRAAACRLAESGAKALARSDLAWGGSLLLRALDLVHEGEFEWITAARRLAEVRLATGHTDEGRSLLQAVLTSAAGIDRPAETDSGTGAETSESAGVGGGGETAVVPPASAGGTAAEVAERTMAVSEPARDGLGRTRARIRMAQERQPQGRHAEAGALLTRGLAHAQRSGAEPERSLALGAVGVSLWHRPAPVPEAASRVRSLLAQHGERRLAVRLTVNCPPAVLLALQERWEDVYACMAQARRLADGVRYAERAAVLSLFNAVGETLAGNEVWDEAAAGHAFKADGVLDAVARESARLLVDPGGIDEAVEHLAATAGLYGLMARIAAAQGRPMEASTLSERAVHTAAGTDSPLIRAVTWLDRADVLWRAGRLAEACAAELQAKVAPVPGRGRPDPGSRSGPNPLLHRTPKGR
ncbi:adenylate/guanylate cyclase domain-containing protein [Streptomyces sp. NPDC046915]|uniref:AAA family ATPase n=1 Tax=Streptomyces sp. NPDC046915 TaxID=3155257 RepID=UPI0033FE9B25